MEERRHSPRHKSLLQGRVFYNNRRSSVDCVVRDFTIDGARLRFADTVAVPEAFELHIPNKQESYQARVIWNNGTDVGVSFEHAAHNAARDHHGIPIATDLTDRVAKLEHEMAMLKRRIDELMQ